SLAASNQSSAFWSRPRRLKDRRKQRRLTKPYSRRISTTFDPIKPLDPVTRMQSDGEAICFRLICARQISFACHGFRRGFGDRVAVQEAKGSRVRKRKLFLMNDRKIARRHQTACERMRVYIWSIA